ncbi:MAG: hypothetical protein SAK29_11995 [Scytonema sp. PMC 1069.18]|nr:hypothetical protein [Scytonema sp. PMC 1069.18]MEC4884511.1 hypothetical protein [Scytonema sp. PMC 1070.18]
MRAIAKERRCTWAYRLLVVESPPTTLGSQKGDRDRLSTPTPLNGYNYSRMHNEINQTRNAK